MIATLVRRYIAGPIARAVARIPFEPVVVAGLALEALLLLRDQLSGGADLETALTAVIIAIGTRIVRQNVWPNAKVDQATGAAVVELEPPITGLEDGDYA